MICNYVYEHVEDNTQHAVNYRNVFPVEKEFTWKDIGHFRPSQYLLMHLGHLPDAAAAGLRTGAAQAHVLCG